MFLIYCLEFFMRLWIPLQPWPITWAVWVIIIKLLSMNRTSVYCLKGQENIVCNAQRLFLDIWQQSFYPCLEAGRWQMRQCLTMVHVLLFKSMCKWWVYRGHNGNTINPCTKHISPGCIMMFKTWQVLKCFEEHYCIWNRK